MREALWALAGVAFGGGMALLRDWLRHTRLRKERMEELLLADRLRVYKELAARLTSLWWDVPLLQTGFDPLRWPKNRLISPEYFVCPKAEGIKEKEAFAQGVHERLEDLKAFVHRNAIALASSVQEAFWRAFFEVATWRAHLAVKHDGDFGTTGMQRIMEAWDNLHQNACEAMAKDLEMKGFAMLPQGELPRIHTEVSKGVHAVMAQEQEVSSGREPQRGDCK